MLIRFCVENFLSFKDEVEFSMVAGKSDEHSDHIHEVRDLRILKTGVIFGANASGKTNLIKAMAFAQNFITSGSLKTDNLELAPFLLDSESAAKPSEFLFEIQCGIGQCFQYYFCVDSKRVHKETLHEIRSGTTSMLFERETDSQGRTHIEIGEVNVLVTNEEDPFDFVPSFRLNELFLTAINLDLSYGSEEGENQKVGFAEDKESSPTRPFARRTAATSFSPISIADSPKRRESRIAFLDTIFDWFDQTLATVFPDSIPTQGIGLGIMKESDFKRRLRDVIEVLDLGIDDFELHPIEFNPKTDIQDEYREYVLNHVEKIPEGSNASGIFTRPGSEVYLIVDKKNQFSAYQLVSVHLLSDESQGIAFDLSMESDGTRRLLALLPALFRLHSGQSDRVFVIDELDRSLHTHLTYNILDQFLTSTVNDGSQLIVTTHDTGLLDLDLLRPDEIWFIEKDRTSSSLLFSLEEFKLPENMNIQKGYLGGRFGALPILSILHEHETAE